MTKPILISVFVSMIFAGFESAADTAGSMVASGHDGGHEVHGSSHSVSHQHAGENHDDEHDDEHFCHCSAHAVALLCIAVVSATEDRSVSSYRYKDHFSSLADPPLPRPPDS